LRFATIATLVALFIVTQFVACLGVVILPDALSSQPHSRLFKEATERSSDSGRISVDVNMAQESATTRGFAAPS